MVSDTPTKKITVVDSGVCEISKICALLLDEVRAKNFGILPDWHPGKGNPTWLFIDEIAFE